MRGSGQRTPGPPAGGIAGGLVVTLFALTVAALVSQLTLLAAGGGGSFVVLAACASAGFASASAVLLWLYRGPVPLRFRLADLPPSAVALAGVLLANLAGTRTGDLLGETYTGAPEPFSGLPAGGGVILLAVLLAPAAEELFFRELLQVRVLGEAGDRKAIVLSAVAFGLFHMTSGGAVLVGTMTLIGAALGWLRARSGSLLPPFLVHALNNAAALALLS